MTFVSYAQNYEDVILARVFRDMPAGFYIDVGAQDPLVDSVTKAFYDRGWQGINIEPVEHWHRRLCQDRARDINLRLAAGAAAGQIGFFEVVGTGLSTASAQYAQRHREQGFAVVERQVPVQTLDAICQQQGVQQVHFLKIDVEGAEGAVLDGIRLDQLRPWVIVVEATEPRSRASTHEQWEPALLARGYRMVYRDGLNRFYLADEHAGLAEAFDLPPNVFDDFARHFEWLRAALDFAGVSASQQVTEQKWLAAEARNRQMLEELARVSGELEPFRGQAERLVREVAGLTAEVARQSGEIARQAEEIVRQSGEIVRQAEVIARQEEQAAQQSALTAHQEELATELRHRLEAGIALLQTRLFEAEREGSLVSRALLDAEAGQRHAAISWAAARADHERTRGNLSSLQREHQRMLDSRSWRLTAPLRATKSILADAARAAARIAVVRRLVAISLMPFPRPAARIKRALYGAPIESPPPTAPSAPLPISEDAEAILARYPIERAPGSGDPESR